MFKHHFSQYRLFVSKLGSGKYGLVDNMCNFVINPDFNLITDFDNQQHDRKQTKIFIVKKTVHLVFLTTVVIKFLKSNINL